MRGRRANAGPVSALGFVGNPGCIRFPVPVRSASGVKRGDRLWLQSYRRGELVLVRADHATEGTRGSPSDRVLDVDPCRCPAPPRACRGREPIFLAVGWSYVQLEAGLARRLGFRAGAPIRIVGEPGRIVVTLQSDARGLSPAMRLACPP
jgi:hypothetical protein